MIEDCRRSTASIQVEHPSLCIELTKSKKHKLRRRRQEQSRKTFWRWRPRQQHASRTCQRGRSNVTASRLLIREDRNRRIGPQEAECRMQGNAVSCHNHKQIARWSSSRQCTGTAGLLMEGSWSQPGTVHAHPPSFLQLLYLGPLWPGIGDDTSAESGCIQQGGPGVSSYM